jgi:signal peptidase I
MQGAMARTRDSGWIWITVAVIGGIVMASGIALRISGTLGGPGYDLYDIPSNSMFPSVRFGDYILAFANVYRNEVPPRGQIVVFKYPPDGKTDYIKRVIGLPGDRVQLRAGRLFINDQLVPREPAPDIEAPDYHKLRIYRETLPGGAFYLIAEASDEQELDNTEVFTVPDGSVFVLGDNRDHSSDSRIRDTVGYVPLALLRDKPVLVYWSKEPKRIGTNIR